MALPAIFFDRDGVINRAIVREGKPFPPASLTEFEILPDAVDSCKKLKQAGYLLFIVTNQPDIARGTLDNKLVESYHEIIRQSLPIDGIYICPHDNEDGCDCRKPQPGLILSAAKDWDVKLSSSFIIGDRWKDVAAGKRAGCKTVFIDYKYSEELSALPDHIVNSLTEAVEWILSFSGARHEASK
jgi:D-glycero-D-manno-heptose 1,7-bisphosphate phosphatase